ncbi:AAA family ATPase [Nonomuraea antimicrobica]|uniref:nSTAND1 domain-containing NTPase n=1 Tax=Nonomuraea antimicrobica TaxID=561173 RepID=UPI0031EB10C3
MAELVQPDTSAANPEAPLAHPDPNKCPYPGLTPFGTEDAAYFFGRDESVKQLTRLVTGIGASGLIALFGASGTGKSSLVHAGLLPRLDAAWHHVVITPGACPLDELVAAVAALTGADADAFRDEFAADQEALHLALSRWVVRQPPQTRALLVIDQFEEVFTMDAPPAVRGAFLTLLADAARMGDDRVRLLIVVRADFYSHCSRHPHLAAALREGVQIPLGALDDDELRSVIVGPPEVAGLTVEPELIGALQQDTAEQPGGLALLAHALRQTWLRHIGDELRLTDYHAIGGVRGAVAQSAERVYAHSTSTEQRILRGVFLRLTALGEGTDDTRRRIGRSELRGLAPTGDIDRLLEELASARLVVLDEQTVDIAHEAVILAWPRLRRWLIDDRASLRAHRRITQAVEIWRESGHDRSALYRGGQLAAARAWARSHPEDLNEREMAFLAAGVAAHRRRRWMARSLVGVVTALAVLATIGAVLAVRGQQEVIRQRDLALSQNVAAQAVALRETDPALSAQMSLAAYHLAPTVEARSGLLSTFAQPYAVRLTDHHDHVNTIAFGPGGALAATASRDGTAKLWDTADPHRPRMVSTLRGHTGNVASVAFSPNGRTLATTGWDDQVVLWDITRPTAPRSMATLTGHGSDVNTAAFSADGRLLATGSTDRTIRLWDPSRIGRPKPIATLRGHRDTVVSVVFDPRGQNLVTADWTGTVRLWDVGYRSRPRALAVLPRAGGPVTAAFAPSGNLLATGGQDRVVRLWDVTDPRRPRRAALQRGHTDTIRAMRFSPDGARLATAGADGSLRLWPIDNGRRLGESTVMTGHTNAVVSVDFSPDGRFVATSSDDSTARLWDLSGFGLRGHSDSVYGIALQPDGRVAATASYDRTIRLWSLARSSGYRAIAALAGHSDAVNSVAFNHSGTILASASADRTVRLWDVTDPLHPRPGAILRRHNDAVNAASFEHDGGRDLLVTAGTDRVARLWDASDIHRPTPLSTLTGHTDAINAALVHRGLTVTASADRTARLWNVADPRRPHLIAVLGGHADAVKSVALSLDGRRLATASADRTVWVWDISNPVRPRRMATLTGHVNTVYAVAFSMDGQLLASAGADHTVRLWDLREPSAPKHYATLTGHRNAVDTLSFMPHGRTLISGSQDGSALVWAVDPQEVARRVCQTASPPLSREQWRQHFPGVAVRLPCGAAGVH